MISFYIHTLKIEALELSKHSLKLLLTPRVTSAVAAHLEHIP